MKYNKAMPDSLRLVNSLKETGGARRSLGTLQRFSHVGEDWWAALESNQEPTD